MFEDKWEDDYVNFQQYYGCLRNLIEPAELQIQKRKTLYKFNTRYFAKIDSQDQPHQHQTQVNTR